MSNRLTGATLNRWQARYRRTRGQWAGLIAITAAGILLAACSRGPNLGKPGYVEGFAGAVVADEPHAAIIGRDVLAGGGSAGDAAAAAFFALAVTKPATAGLAAHGYCLDYLAEDQTHRAYRFSSPAAVRTMAAIHARLGRFPWRQTVGQAEALARFGFKRSVAFVNDWRAAAPRNPAAHAVLGSNNTVGADVQQLDLASLLSQIRQHGGGAFYSGRAAQQIWGAAAADGFRINEEAWREAVPVVSDPTTQPLGDHTLASMPIGLAVSAGNAAGAESNLVVADGQGNAVACVFSMGRPFGLQRMVGGIFFAAAGEPVGEPVLVTNPNTKILLGAIAGGVSRRSVEALAAQMIEGDVPADQALAQGHRGQVNAIACYDGLPNYSQSCTASSDPKGYGLAAVGEPAQ